MPWPTKKLREIIELHYGKGIPRHDRKPNGKLPIYGANGELGRTDKFLVEGDALIIGRKGTAGEVTRVSGRFWPADVTYYVFGNDQVDVDYLFYALKRLDLKQLATGIKPGINRNKVYELKIPLPPPPEQKRIVEKIEKLFAKIDEASRLREEASTASAALLPSALHQVFSRAKKEGWEEKELGEICNLYQPKTITLKEIKSEGHYKVFGANGVIGYYDKYNHEDSQVLVTCRGATCGSVNMSEPKSWITGNAMVVHPKTNNLSRNFLFFILKAVDMSQAISGSAQPQITRTSLSPIKIPLPPLAEQKKIVAYLDSLSAKTRELQNLQNETAADFSALRQSVLSKAFV